jgi:hypothetical protein
VRLETVILSVIPYMKRTVIKRHKKIRRDLTQQKFGKLLCIRPTGHFKHGVREWECLCDCGKTHYATSNHLVRGGIKSCGCAQFRSAKEHQGWLGFGDISGRYFGQLRRGAKHRNLPFEVTLKYVWNLYLKQNKRCALTGEPLEFYLSESKRNVQTASLDRIDSTKGYIEGNVQWIHQCVNFMKQDLSETEFKQWCQRVCGYSKCA